MLIDVRDKQPRRLDNRRGHDEWAASEVLSVTVELPNFCPSSQPEQLVYVPYVP